MSPGIWRISLSGFRSTSMILVLLFSVSAFSQGSGPAPAAPAAGAGPAPGGLPSAPQGGRVPGGLPISPMGVGPQGYNPMGDLNAPLRLSADPTVQMSQGESVAYSGGGGAPSRREGLMQGLKEVASFCKDMFFPPSEAAGEDRRTIEDILFEKLENAEPEYIEGSNHEEWSKYGSEYQEYFASGSCQQKFISKDGKLGGWGKFLMIEFGAETEFYNDPNGPDDIESYCPKFRSFDNATRYQFWTWHFLSLASPESSCDAKAVNHGAPNGSAIGLYQLEPKACRSVGLNYSASDLYHPLKNIRCAVKLFAREMKYRNTLGATHSKNKTGTYWGPLRTDDHNKGRGGDIHGARKFRSLLSQFPACQ